MTGTEFSIVGIGASAGGLEAFHKFFDYMPADSGLAFVMILHLPADRKSMLPEILSRWTRMRVIEGQDGMTLEANSVYVPPPHSIVTLRDGRLEVRMPAADDLKLPRPIDAFFDSLGAALGSRAIGIVLSGTGSDGALGLKAIKEHGGLTIAQSSEGSAPQYGEMPAGAIATGAVDLVASVEDIPGQLMRMRSSEPGVASAEESVLAADAARLEICAILRAQVGHDFSGYRDKTFLRRVQRRMLVVGASTLDAYVARLQVDHNEVVLLFRDLLIRVTSFFRDQETFDTLEALVIPRLFAGKQADGTVRVWVPGCATGEEAYSLAILLREQMDRMDGVPKVQLFATDIDEAAISTARLGRYPDTLLAGLSAERRERFFKASQGGFVVSKEIRALCTFSPHNLISDPPFSRMDLVSCRNLLIYMEVELQATIIPAFHFSLVTDGILLLGGAESTARHEKLFEPLDKAARIFKRRAGPSPALKLDPRRSDLALQRAVLENTRLPRANLPAGAASRSDLSLPIEGERKSTIANVGPLTDDVPQTTATTLADSKRPLEPADASDMGLLKQELLSTQERFQSLTEQHETALEELRSSNEELHSVNEEMQSANEELETSKEELQSVNEELHSVNLQLSEKNNELADSNSDLRNLFEGTEIATIFLDRHLIIRSFTPAIATLYSLIRGDVGRPLSNIVSCLAYDHLSEDVASVLATLTPLERRIARKDRSTHYIMRILPYRAPDNRVSGVLVTFVDVTSIVQAEAALREADLRKDVFLATLSHELRNPLAPIRTAARLLAAPNAEPAHLAQAQAIISRQVTHMSSLLDDLLDVSRITRGSFALKKERIDVKSLLEAAVESVQPALDARHHTLRTEVPEIAAVLHVDPVRMTQVLTNLLMNAAKYTPDGGLIIVGGRLEAHDLLLYVRDNGIGIAPAMIPQIFDMFTQVDSTERASEGGLGIGLALVRGLVQLHGGRIVATSAGLGKGSEFVVSLPVGLIVTPAPAGLEHPDGSADLAPPRRVLVADDNQDGAESLAMLLNLAGHEVFLAHCGEDAIQMAERERPDVAVIDIGMPDISGYEVAKRIRQAPWGEQIKLIALTGWGQENDKRMAQAAGFDHHCTKPVDPDRLASLFT
jgi:two-component system CheB/CheR fusion protein